MAASAPIMPFLRPMGLPRPATLRHFLRFSTSTPCRAAEAFPQGALAHGEDPNLLASQTASPTYPPQSMKSLPRPKESRASHRTKHPRPNRHYPTRHPTHTPVQHARLTPTPVEPLPATQCAPNLPYFVTRSRNNELPVYTLRKRGGNLPMTRVKNVDGRAEALKEELAGLLGLGRGEAAVNDVTGHVVLKGHHKPAVEKFLRERMF